MASTCGAVAALPRISCAARAVAALNERKPLRTSSSTTLDSVGSRSAALYCGPVMFFFAPNTSPSTSPSLPRASCSSWSAARSASVGRLVAGAGRLGAGAGVGAWPRSLRNCSWRSRSATSSSRSGGAYRSRSFSSACLMSTLWPVASSRCSSPCASRQMRVTRPVTHGSPLPLPSITRYMARVPISQSLKPGACFSASRMGLGRGAGAAVGAGASAASMRSMIPTASARASAPSLRWASSCARISRRSGASTCSRSSALSVLATRAKHAVMLVAISAP